MRKTHSMFYAYLQCSVASVLPRGMGLSPGFYFMFYFFGSLEREPSLWENTWPWEILRTWESFPGIRLGNQDLWGGEKESTFDTGRRVETGTYHWEGRKPFIQTFDLCQRKMRLKKNDLGCSAFIFSMQLNLEAAFKIKKEKGWQSQSPSITTCFFLLRTYFQENAIQPRVNQSLGHFHANPFPKN